MIKVGYKAEEVCVVIVGVNSGIGQSLAQQLLESGATVFGVDIQEVSLKPTSKVNFYFKANPMNEAEMKVVCQQIEEKTAAINGLINLSGTIKQFKPITEMTMADWNETYDISFKSCFNACKIFTPLLQKSAKAAIVNMSSGLAFIGQKNYGPYTTAKASVVSFSKTLAAELAPEIRVNTVAPGAVDTNFIYKEDGSTRFDKEGYTKMVPLKAIGTPNEIAAVILFLLSNGASHMTGQCLHVNGGAGMR